MSTEMMYVDIEKPRYDQSTYLGRCQHFFLTTNPLNVFASPSQLEEAGQVVRAHRCGVAELGTEYKISKTKAEEVWRAKTLFDSAFHPDTHEKMPLVGRMSAQVPMNMTITGCMLTFYRTTPQVIFWQWVNQSFNALVNFTNRSGDVPISKETLGISYCAATTGAVTTALALNSVVGRLPPTFPSVVARLVPFVSVCAANSINIPLMRRNELTDGVTLFTEDGQEVGKSVVAAREGISKVVLSRILMAAPGMVIVPFAMDRLERRPFLKQYPRAAAPLQIFLCGIVLTFATPMCCAIFEQKASIPAGRVEVTVNRELQSIAPQAKLLFYNKGL